MKLETRQALEPLLVFIVAVAVGSGGYAIASSALDDGKLAFRGFQLGTAAFAMVVTALAVGFRIKYRAAGGSPALVALVAWLVAGGSLLL
jgi:hypothetical protein